MAESAKHGLARAASAQVPIPAIHSLDQRDPELWWALPQTKPQSAQHRR